MSNSRSILVVVACVAACTPAGLPSPLPIKLAPRATSAAITAADLATRLYILADDSMLGREAGTVGNLKGTAYIASEARRLGLVPMGDNGGYFQDIPLVERGLAATIRMSLDGGRDLVVGREFQPILGRGNPRAFTGAPAVFGGVWADSTTWISREQSVGKIVVFDATRGSAAGFRSPRLTATSRFGDAAAIAIASLDEISPRALGFLTTASTGLSRGTQNGDIPPSILVSRDAAQTIMGAPLSSLQPGAPGRRVSGSVAFAEKPVPARNVVAVLPGSDPALRGQYVAIGAHNDHNGLADRPADHDSVRAYNSVIRPRGADSDPHEPTAGEWATIRHTLDSLRALRRPRLDSVYNGADDDGSGSVTVLEVAEALVRGNVHPRRSVLFVWHTGEEKGLLGSQYVTDHPPVPRDSIVAQLNMDMVGRGGPQDEPGGGPSYLQMVGWRRLSNEMGDIIDRVNKAQPLPFTFDFTYDQPGQSARIYCRSDHANYARYGIPVAFFTTGLHRDYHQLTDEPQYIDYPHMARIANFMSQVLLQVANLDHRLVVDGRKPADPRDACVQ